MNILMAKYRTLYTKQLTFRVMKNKIRIPNMSNKNEVRFTAEEKKMLARVMSQVDEMRSRLSGIEHKVEDHGKVLQDVQRTLNQLHDTFENTGKAPLGRTFKNPPSSYTPPSDAEYLFSAAEDGDTDSLLQMLQDGVNVHCRNEDGESALHMAANNGHDNAVIILLGAGLPVGAQDNQQCTALHLAAGSGHYRVVRRLCDAGADVDADDEDGNTPLLVAARNGNTSAVTELLQYGAAINKSDSNGRTPLMWAAYNGYTDIVAQLMNSNADTHHTDNKGNTALLLAAKGGRWSIVELLAHDRGSDTWTSGPLSGGAKPDGIGPRTPESETRVGNDRKGSESSAASTRKNRTNLQRAPLLYAAENNEIIRVRELLERETYTDEYLGLAIALASEPTVITAINQAVPRLMQGDVGREAACRTARYGNATLLEALLNCGVNVNAENSYGNTPLHYACYYGHTECVKLLLARGADKNYRGNCGHTPLLDACEQGREECVKLLLNAGANPLIKDEDGRSCDCVAKTSVMRSLINGFMQKRCRPMSKSPTEKPRPKLP